MISALYSSTLDFDYEVKVLTSYVGLINLLIHTNTMLVTHA